MDRPERKSTRLKDYDYSTPGAYFVTICTRDRRCILSDIVKPPGVDVGDGVLDVPQVDLTPYGQTVEDVLLQIDRQYHHICLERYVIMPNHIHLLIRITEGGSSGTPPPTNAVIPSCISTLKRMTNRRCGVKLWQRSFHDHIVRNEDDYCRIAEYIDANPARWTEDRFYAETE